MAIINQRWPRDLAPETCNFGRSRNDVAQESPRSRKRSVIRQGRPLWSAEVSWSLPNTDRLAKLRYWLEALDGFNGSAQLWDFSSPRPDGVELVTTGPEPSRIYWTYSGVTMPWTLGGMPSYWAYDATLPLAAGASAGATSITFSGLTAGAIVALQGQYVQIGRRVYVVAATSVVAVGGTATVTLVTPLIAAASSGAAVRFVEAACEMELVSQSWSASARAGDGFVHISATFRETVEDKT